MQNRTFAKLQSYDKSVFFRIHSCPDSELDDFRALDICPFPWPERVFGS